MNVLISLAAVGGLFLLGTLGAVSGMGWIFGVVLPYLAVGIGIGGLIWRVLSWANVPVPFRIPTTCGQQKSLPWIKNNSLENPHNSLTAVGRMALEVLFFRSLLRNTKAEVIDQRRLVYTSAPWLWIGAMAFHWSFLIILVRHLRLLANPVPWCVTFLQRADGFLEIGLPVIADGSLKIGLPVIYVTTVLFIAGLAYLLVRRLASPQLRYISLAGDYFPLFLLLGIGISGFWMRHLTKTDIVSVKQVAVGLSGFSFDSDAMAAAGALFYGHLFLVCVLLAYFPFSKLSHFAGVFLSPTRNMANSNRSVRHVNPWDYPVKVHPYDEYEDEFREKMKSAGVPVEKE